MTVQLLLGPEEHVPFLQHAVLLWDIPHPDGGTFPKNLPKQCLPDKPNAEMERWHRSVTSQLNSENYARTRSKRSSYFTVPKRIKSSTMSLAGNEPSETMQRGRSLSLRRRYSRPREEKGRSRSSSSSVVLPAREPSLSGTENKALEPLLGSTASIRFPYSDLDSGYHSISWWSEGLRNISTPSSGRVMSERFEGSLRRNLTSSPFLDIRNHRQYKHTFEIHWECREYICQEFEPSESIKDMMVLWQDGNLIRLTNCTQYIGCINPRIFDAIASILQNLTQSPEKSFSRLLRDDGKLLSLYAKLTPNAPQDEEHFLHTEFILESDWWPFKYMVQEILRRLAVVPRLANNTLSWSEAHVEDGEGLTSIQLLPLQNAQVLSCWRPIFSQKVIAKSLTSEVYSSSSILSPDLELEFSDLVDLCGVMFPIDLDGGICLSGTYTLLIPIETRQDFDRSEQALVWHLLTADYSERRPSKARRQLWSVWNQWSQAQGNKWFRVQSVDDLQCFKRHVLGWIHFSTVTLGTDRQPYTLRRSQAPIESREHAETTFNIGISAGYAGSGVSAGRSIKLGRTELSRYHDRDKHILDWLGESTEEQVLLYHPDKQQAWLLSKVAVVHHLALERMHYVISRQEVGDLKELEFLYLKFEDPNPSIIYDLLVSNLDTPFPHYPGQQYKLRDALNSILCMLDQFERSNLLGNTRRTFMGFEAYDTIHQSSYFRVKKANTSNHPLALRKLGGWVNMLEDVPVILFYRGIFDPIVPIPQDGNHRCADCVRMPRGRNYLAATITSLWELGKKYSTEDFDCIQLASNAYWHYRKAWDDIDHKHETCIEERSQAIWTYQSYCDGPPRKTLRRLTNAAVIFTPGMGIMSV